MYNEPLPNRRKQAEAFFSELHCSIICSREGINLNWEDGKVYIGDVYAAITAPHGIRWILYQGRDRAELKHMTDMGMARILRDEEICLQFGEGQVVVFGRITYPNRHGFECAHMILVPRYWIPDDRECLSFNGGIEFYDPRDNLPLTIEGFKRRAPRTPDL